MLINIFIYLDHQAYLEVHPNDRANSGTASAMLFIARFYITRGIAIVLFIPSIILNILNKTYFNLYAIISVIVIILTYYSPFFMSDISNFLS